LIGVVVELVQRLLGESDAGVGEVLSEGEHRSVALAAFLAEPHPQPAVLREDIFDRHADRGDQVADIAGRRRCAFRQLPNFRGDDREAFPVLAGLRSEDGRDTDLAVVARRDGVALAVNTVQHHIGNKLAVTVGHSEMLADDPRLPPDAREQANKALASAMAAADVMHQLAHQLVRVELDTNVAGPALLDVDASTRAS